MERRLAGLFLVALSVGTGACLVVDTDDVGGGISSGGSPSTGGSVGDGGSGGSVGNGGAPGDCEFNADCPEPEFECSDACYDAAGDTCFEQFSVAGSICSAGICDGAGFCVECLDDTDCTGAGETCDVKSGTCINQTQTGDCADSFCLALPATGACVNCLISAGQGDCSVEFQACNSDADGAGCATCLEHVQGSADPFCNGSQVKFEAYFDCVCSSGVCLD